MNTHKLTSTITQYVGILFFFLTTVLIILIMVINQSYSLFLLTAISISTILLAVYINVVRIEITGRTILVKKIYTKTERFESTSLVKVKSLLGQLCYIRFDNGKTYFFLASLLDYIKQGNYVEYIDNLIQKGVEEN